MLIVLAQHPFCGSRRSVFTFRCASFSFLLCFAARPQQQLSRGSPPSSCEARIDRCAAAVGVVGQAYDSVSVLEFLHIAHFTQVKIVCIASLFHNDSFVDNLIYIVLQGRNVQGGPGVCTPNCNFGQLLGKILFCMYMYPVI